MTNGSQRARRFLDEARANRPSLDAARRARLKRSVVASVAVTAATATGAQAGLLSQSSWVATALGKVALGVGAAALGSGLTYGAMVAKRRVDPPVAVTRPAKPSATVQLPAPAEPAPTSEGEHAAEGPRAEPTAEVTPSRPLDSSVRAPTRVIAQAPAPEAAQLETPPVHSAPLAQPTVATPPLERVEVASASARRAVVEPLERSLKGELELLQRALALHDASDSNGALAMLATYEVSYPRGALRVEALSLNAVVLCELGRVDEARAARAALTREFPEAKLSPRLLACDAQ